MTQIELTIEAALNRFCDQNGGGKREVILSPGRFGGFDATLVWDGFETIGLGKRQDGVVDILVASIGTNLFQIVRNLHLVTFSEYTYEEKAKEYALDGGPALAAAVLKLLQPR
jgi:hypothetical protein